MTKPDIVWIIDDDKSIRWVVEKALQKAGIITRTFSSGNDLLGVFGEGSHQCLSGFSELFQALLQVYGEEGGQ